MDQMQPIDMEYKPWGGLAGAYSGIQSSQIDQSNQNRLAMQGLENTIKGVQAGRDLADYSNPEYEKWRQAGDIGKNQTLAASGKYDQSVLDSKIDRGIAENFAGKSKAQVEQGIAEDTQLLRELRSLYSMGEQTQFGNQWLYSGKQYAAQKGFPQEAIEPFVKDPTKLKLVIDHLESALARTPAVLQKMAETTHSENAKIPGHLAGIALQNAGHAATNAATNATNIEIHRLDRESRERIELAKAEAKKAVYEQAKNEYAQFNKDNENYLKNPTPENAAKLRMSYKTYKMKLQSQILNKPDLQTMGIDVMSMPSEPPALQQGSGSQPIGDGTPGNPIKLK